MTDDYEAKVNWSKHKTEGALSSLLFQAFPGQPFNIDYDIDTRHATVTAFTTFLYLGRRFRVSIEEETE